MAEPELSVVSEPELPYPPLELANRVGSLADASKPFEYYDELGRETRKGIIDALPSDWTFTGKRILDFGCGAGRTLRHFTAETAEAEFWGCDIDEESIGWMKDNMCPPFHVFMNGAEPPLDQPDSSFDLIWAISVFTHLASSWSRWLVELHRVLNPDGLLVVTFMGRGMSEEIAGEPWDEGGFGMNVIRYGQSWDLGGPMVIHSPWWIEEHWGRAFEILSLVPDGFGRKPWLDHGSVLMRKRNRAVDPKRLERISARDGREARALIHNIWQLQAESSELRADLSYVDSKLEESVRDKRLLEAEHGRVLEEIATLRRTTTVAQQQAAAAREQSLASGRRLLEVEEVVAQSKARIFALEEALDGLQQRLERADGVVASMKTSLSWRMTAPLRALKRLG